MSFGGVDFGSFDLSSVYTPPAEVTIPPTGATQAELSADAAAWTGMPDIWATSNPVNPVPITVTPQPASPDSTGKWVATAIAGGLQVLNTALGYNLQQSQIAHGQVPSIAYDPKTGAPIGQSAAGITAAQLSGSVASILSSSTIIYFLIAAVVLYLVTKR